MSDHYNEMRVAPDPAQAEALRQHLHARIASASLNAHEGRSDLQPNTARVDPEHHLVPVKESYVSVDSTTKETRNRRRLALAAAAVVAVIGGAAITISTWNSEDKAPAVPPTVAPTTTVAPGTETGAFVGTDGVPVTFVRPRDWVVFDGWLVHNEGPNDTATGVSFWDVSNIYAEGCQWVLVDPPIGPTVDDLVSAFANLPSLAATAAVDVTVDGYVGKQITFTVPDYNQTECKSQHFGLWQEDGNSQPGPPFWAQGPKMHNQLWILDVGGTRLVIDAYFLPDTSQEDRAALDEVLASIQIG